MPHQPAAAWHRHHSPCWKRETRPPAPHLFPQGLANHPQLQAPVMARAGRFAAEEQPGLPARPLTHPAPAALLSHWPLVKGPSSGFGLMHQRITCYWPRSRCLLAHIWDQHGKQCWYLLPSQSLMSFYRSAILQCRVASLFFLFNQKFYKTWSSPYTLSSWSPVKSAVFCL